LSIEQKPRLFRFARNADEFLRYLRNAKASLQGGTAKQSPTFIWLEYFYQENRTLQDIVFKGDCRKCSRLLYLYGRFVQNLLSALLLLNQRQRRFYFYLFILQK